MTPDRTAQANGFALDLTAKVVKESQNALKINWEMEKRLIINILFDQRQPPPPKHITLQLYICLKISSSSRKVSNKDNALCVLGC